MEAIDLLLAAEIRKLAVQLRRDRWSTFAAAAEIRSDGGKHSLQFEQMKARWEQDHPIAHYVPDATAQLNNVALQIKEILQKKQETVSLGSKKSRAPILCLSGVSVQTYSPCPRQS